ncbi:MAG: hypothetical protein JNM93_04965 [Bacteriovoracaceae bacterium]|nr:hypothetical protein [Bacteriovoracaceae bacterium]
MKKILSLLVVLVTVASCSCSKEEPKLTKVDIMLMIYKGDNTAEEVLPRDMNSGVKCTDYGPGCLRGYQGRILGLDATFVEFETDEQALAEATRVNGYYLKNWLFDDVSGEPVLERFFKRYLNAKRPGEIDAGAAETSPEKN